MCSSRATAVLMKLNPSNNNTSFFAFHSKPLVAFRLRYSCWLSRSPTSCCSFCSSFSESLFTFTSETHQQLLLSTRRGVTNRHARTGSGLVAFPFLWRRNAMAYLRLAPRNNDATAAPKHFFSARQLSGRSSSRAA